MNNVIYIKTLLILSKTSPGSLPDNRHSLRASCKLQITCDNNRQRKSLCLHYSAVERAQCDVRRRLRKARVSRSISGDYPASANSVSNFDEMVDATRARSLVHQVLEYIAPRLKSKLHDRSMAALEELCYMYGDKTFMSRPVRSIQTPRQNDEKESSYWYFGYGSNLNSETFLVKRGIRPLQHKRMLIPGWKLNFEIRGIPYLEPAFGSIDRLTDEDVKSHPRQPVLQGIAYLVTATDYWHIIATEGGDSSYQQIELDAVDPMTNSTQKVWSLQAIAPRKLCQPSVRYITIIREGAKQHNFPQEYLDYLESIEPFVLHSKRQKVGAAIFIAFWMPIILWLFAIRTLLTRPDGTAPRWLTEFANTCFATAWYIHDTVWAQEFGRGDHNVSKHDRPGLSCDEQV